MSDRFLQGFMEDFIRGVSSPITATTTGGASYTPASTYDTGVLGPWLYSYPGETTDLKVNTDGTGGNVADGGTIGRWSDHLGRAYHATQSTANLRPYLRDGKVCHFHATNTTGRSSWLGNASIAAIDRRNCSGGFLVDIFDLTGPLPILDLGASGLAFIAGINTNANSMFLSYFANATYNLGSNVYTGKKCVVTWRSNASGLTINVNGQEATYAALSSVSMTKFRVASFDGGLPAPHQGYEFVIFDSDVGATEIAKLRSYLNTKGNTAALNAAKVVIEVGDSIDGAVGCEIGKPSSDYVTNRSDSTWYRFNKEGGFLSAGGHISTAQIISLKGATETVVIYGAGTNDIMSGFKTGAQTYTELTSLTSTLRASGIKVLWTTLGDFVSNRAQKDAYNASVLANAATLADGLIRRDDILPDCTDTTLFTTDQVHPKTAGHALYGAAKQAAMAALP